MKNIYTLLDEINFEERIKKEIDLIKNVKNSDNFDNIVSDLVFTNFVFSFIQEIYEKIYDENEVLQEKLHIAILWLDEISESCDMYFEKERTKEFADNALCMCAISANQALEKIKEIK